MKLWEIIRDNKEGKYKVRHTYRDGYGGFCITALLSNVLLGENGWSLPQVQLDKILYDTLRLSSHYGKTAFGDMSPFLIQHTPKSSLLRIFKETIIANNNTVCTRDLVLLNDYSEVDYDDFEELFKELDI